MLPYFAPWVCPIAINNPIVDLSSPAIYVLDHSWDHMQLDCWTLRCVIALLAVEQRRAKPSQTQASTRVEEAQTTEQREGNGGPRH